MAVQQSSLVPRPSRVFQRATFKNTGRPGYEATTKHTKKYSRDDYVQVDISLHLS